MDTDYVGKGLAHNATRLYDILFHNIEGHLVETKNEVADISNAAMEYALGNGGGHIKPEDYKKFQNAVYNFLMTKGLIECIPASNPNPDAFDHKTRWKQVSPRDFSVEEIGQLTNELIISNPGYMQCRLMGVQTMQEYNRNLYLTQ